jgi:hypothetical protein
MILYVAGSPSQSPSRVGPSATGGEIALHITGEKQRHRSCIVGNSNTPTREQNQESKQKSQ